ncbi:MAG: hypothetical protein RR808_00105 [Akkermansia sp.]
MSDQPNPTPPVLKKRTLLTTSPAKLNTHQLVSEATQAETMPKARFLTPALRAKLEQEQAEQAQQEQINAQRLAEEQELARIAQEQEAIRLAEEQKQARILAEQEAIRLAQEQEQARIIAEKEAAKIAQEQEQEQELARIAAEQEQTRIAKEQEEEARIATQAQKESEATSSSSSSSDSQKLDQKVIQALAQIKEAQEALRSAQQQALSMVGNMPPPSGVQSTPPPSAEAESSQPTTKFKIPTGGINPGSKKEGTTHASSQKGKNSQAIKLTAPTFKKTRDNGLSTTTPAPTLSAPKLTASSLSTGTSEISNAPEVASESTPPSAIDATDTPQTAPTPTGVQEPQVIPPSLWQKKSFKIYASVAVAVALLSGIIIYVKISDAAKLKKENIYYTELCKTGSDLGQKSAALGETKGGDILKYDATSFGIPIKPSMKDAKFILKKIENKKTQAGWEAATHLLCVMGQLDPAIADLIITDMGKNPKLFSDSQYTMMVSILSSDKDAQIQKQLARLVDKLGNDKMSGKQSIVLKYMRYGMEPKDVPDLLKYLADPEAKSELSVAAKASLRSITYNADKDGKNQIATNIIEELKKAPNSDDLPVPQRAALFNALALAGTENALNYFKELIKNSKQDLIRLAVRSMGEWNNDLAIPYILSLKNDPVLTSDKVIKDELIKTHLRMASQDTNNRTDDQGREIFAPLIEEAQSLTDKAGTDEKAINEAKKKKILIISACTNLPIKPYVTEIFNKYKADPDAKVAESAKQLEIKMKNREERLKTPKKSTADKAAEWSKRFGN